MGTPEQLTITIYLLRCVSTNKVYVGQTSKLAANRWKTHIKNASLNRQSRLYSAIRKYSPSAFELSILASANNQKSADDLEKLLIGHYQSMNPEHGYNMTEGGDFNVRGREVSDRTRLKHSLASRGRKLPPRSEEWRRKTSIRLRGRKLSPGHVQHISKALSGRRLSVQNRENISKALRGRKLSEDARAKMAEIKRRPEVRAAAARKQLGKKYSLESRLKMSQSAKVSQVGRNRNSRGQFIYGYS